MPDFGVGVNNVSQARALLQQPEYQGFSLAGNGEDCPDRHRPAPGPPLGTIIAQNPTAAGAYQKPGPITYCLSLGPQLGKVPPRPR